MQAWFNFPLGEIGCGAGVLLQEMKNGADTPPTARLRKNWRREQLEGARVRLMEFSDRLGATAFILSGWSAWLDFASLSWLA